MSLSVVTWNSIDERVQHLVRICRRHTEEVPGLRVRREEALRQLEPTTKTI